MTRDLRSTQQVIVLTAWAVFFIYLAASGDKARYLDLTGFVSESSGERFRLSRFYVSCCAADAFPYSVTVLPPGAVRQFAEDTWLRVSGTLERTSEGFLVIAETVRPVEEPDDPYLY